MRILFLSHLVQSDLAVAGSYHGGGWIESLVNRCIEPGNKIALAFRSHVDSLEMDTSGEVLTYRIPSGGRRIVEKLRRYYGGKMPSREQYLPALMEVVQDFRPDIVYIFGLENPLAGIVDIVQVPCIVHLQGILMSVDNAFYPPGFSAETFRKCFSMREWVLRNGFLYSKKELAARSESEPELIRKVNAFVGRTDFDRELVSFFHPEAAYYTVGEVLRDEFYQHAGQAVYRKPGVFRIVSTISETLYKGLDVVLKTAAMLRRHTDLDFEWNVVGVAPDSRIKRIFERECGVRSDEIHVRCLGVLDAGDLCRLELESDLYVSPSYIDNSPNSVCEAQLLGLPVLATEVGGVSSLVEEGKTGFLVPSNGVLELAGRILHLAGNLPLRMETGQRAAEVAARRHDPDQIVNRLLNIMEQRVR